MQNALAQGMTPEGLQALLDQVIPPNTGGLVWTHHSGAELLEMMTAQPALRRQQGWVMRNKALSLMILVLVIALAEPAIAAALPPELRHILGQEEGPLVIAAAFIAAIGAMSDAGRRG